jgi:cation diffusion facilitator CzcD-associated flavoprotein CzcO
MESTVDKFDLRKHMQFGIECLTATWNEEKEIWNILFRDTKTNIQYLRKATIFISAVGGISLPRDIKFPGMEKFQGAIFHTARWDHTCDYRNKRMAVIGNGCSAAQVVPSLARDAKLVKQYARSAQWYHDRPNRYFTTGERWAMRYIPLWQRLQRLKLFLGNDNLVATYLPGPAATRLREAAEENARKYIRSKAPEKYQEILIPDFPLGKLMITLASPHFSTLLYRNRNAS